MLIIILYCEFEDQNKWLVLDIKCKNCHIFTFPNSLISPCRWKTEDISVMFESITDSAEMERILCEEVYS